MTRNDSQNVEDVWRSKNGTKWLVARSNDFLEHKRSSQRMTGTRNVRKRSAEQERRSWNKAVSKKGYPVVKVVSKNRQEGRRRKSQRLCPRNVRGTVKKVVERNNDSKKMTETRRTMTVTWSWWRQSKKVSVVKAMTSPEQSSREIDDVTKKSVVKWNDVTGNRSWNRWRHWIMIFRNTTKILRNTPIRDRDSPKHDQDTSRYSDTGPIDNWCLTVGR